MIRRPRLSNLFTLALPILGMAIAVRSSSASTPDKPLSDACSKSYEGLGASISHAPSSQVDHAKLVSQEIRNFVREKGGFPNEWPDSPLFDRSLYKRFLHYRGTDEFREDLKQDPEVWAKFEQQYVNKQGSPSRPSGMLERRTAANLKRDIEQVGDYFKSKNKLPASGETEYRLLSHHQDDQEFIDAMNSHPVTAFWFDYFRQPPGGRAAIDVIRYFDNHLGEKLTRQTDRAVYSRRFLYKNDPVYREIMNRDGKHLTPEQTQLSPEIESVTLPMSAMPDANELLRLSAIDTAERLIEYIEGGKSLFKLADRRQKLYRDFIQHFNHPAFRARIQPSEKTLEAFDRWILAQSPPKPWVRIATSRISPEETAGHIIDFIHTGWKMDQLSAQDPHLMDAFILSAQQPKFRAAIDRSPEAASAVERWLNPSLRELAPGPTAEKIAESRAAALRLVDYVRSGHQISAINWHENPELYAELIEFASYPSYRAELKKHFRTHKQFLKWIQDRGDQ